MEAFEPLINLLVLMSALSIAAERVANEVKLRDSNLKDSKTDLVALNGAATVEDKQNALKAEKSREQQIAFRTTLVSIIIALAMKADFFEILAHLDAPWDTLGWVHVTGSQWVRSASLASVGQVLYAIAGTFLTGAAMGFGSKFWHDVLDIVYATRDSIKNKRPAEG